MPKEHLTPPAETPPAVAPAQTPASPAWPEPTQGGSYTRDPVTGALTLVQQTLPPAEKNSKE